VNKITKRKLLRYLREKETFNKSLINNSNINRLMWAKAKIMQETASRRTHLLPVADLLTRFRIVHRKNNFAEVSNNFTRSRSENNLV